MIASRWPCRGRAPPARESGAAPRYPAGTLGIVTEWHGRRGGPGSGPLVNVRRPGGGASDSDRDLDSDPLAGQAAQATASSYRDRHAGEDRDTSSRVRNDDSSCLGQPERPGPERPRPGAALPELVVQLPWRHLR